MRRPIDDVLPRLRGVKGVRGGWMALCPTHEDRNQSLKVAEADDAKVLLHCKAGCATPDVVSAMGLRMRDLFPAREGWGRA